MKTEMTLLRTADDFAAWKADNIFFGDQADDPIEFPCFVQTVVASWRNERERAVYLYKADLLSMLEVIGEPHPSPANFK